MGVRNSKYNGLLTKCVQHICLTKFIYNFKWRVSGGIIFKSIFGYGVILIFGSYYRYIPLTINIIYRDEYSIEDN